MSTMQRLTLIGLYNYDSTLFDNLTLPEGYDKPTFIDSLLLEHGEKCVMYTDIDFMKYSIGAISRKWANELTRIYDALTAEYDPISNYDRHEEIKDSRGKKFNEKTEADYTDARTDNLQNKRTADLQDQRTAGLTYTDSQTVAGTTEREVSAYDSSSYAPSEKNTYNNGTSTKTETGLDTVKTSGTDTIDNTGTSNTRHAGTLADKNGGETENYSHTAHMYGNIGVTTNVQMWTEEVKARFKYSLYSVATEIFANELTIGIY